MMDVRESYADLSVSSFEVEATARDLTAQPSIRTECASLIKLRIAKGPLSSTMDNKPDTRCALDGPNFGVTYA